MDSLDMFSSSLDSGLDRDESSPAGGMDEGFGGGFNSNWDLDAELEKVDAREIDLFSGIGIGGDMPPVQPSAEAAALETLSDVERIRALSKKVSDFDAAVADKQPRPPRRAPTGGQQGGDAGDRKAARARAAVADKASSRGRRPDMHRSEGRVGAGGGGALGRARSAGPTTDHRAAAAETRRGARGGLTAAAQQGPKTFRLGQAGSGTTVLRKVLIDTMGWVEIEEEPPDTPVTASRRARGMIPAPPAIDCNLIWRSGRFKMSEYKASSGCCRVNHLPGSNCITRKDLLVRNMRSQRKIHGQVYNIIPTSFVVPVEYTKFAEHYSQLQESGNTEAVWICKPTDMSRGRKIFLLSNISELAYDRQCVVQRYIPNPLLIGGYKSDLRIYVAVTSVHPLRAFIYQEGMVRFSTTKYDISDISNVFSHLTNYSLNKHSDNYGADKDIIGAGAKWLLSRLFEHLKSKNLCDTEVLWERIVNLCLLTLLPLLSNVGPEAAGCFELYGMDVLIDGDFNPWMIEVNASPALGTDGPVDWAVKEPLMTELFTLLHFEDDGSTDLLDNDRSLVPNGCKPRTAPSAGRRSRPTPLKANQRRVNGAAAAGGGQAEERRAHGGFATILPLKGGERLLPTKQRSAAELSKGVVETIRARESVLWERGARRLMDVDSVPRGQRNRNRGGGGGTTGGRLDLAGSLASTDAMIAALMK